MATIARRTPANGAARYRDGHQVHWQIVPSKKDAALGLAKSTHCTKTRAQAVLDDALGEKRETGRVTRLDDPATYADYAPAWLAAMEARNLKPETLFAYRRNVNAHIIPQLGTLRILDTTGSDVEAFTAYLLGPQPQRRGHAEGHRLTVPYVRGVRNTCAQLIEHWAKDHPMPRDGNGNPVNPWRNADKIHGSRKPKRGKAWMPARAQMDAWRAQMPPDVRIVFDVLAFTGNRGCEAWALQERDISWPGKDEAAPLGPQLAGLAELDGAAFAATAPILRTQRKLERDRTEGDVKNTLAERPLPLDRELTAALGAHFAVLPPRDGWLFYNTRPDHGPMAYDAEQAARLEADVARLWAEVIDAGTPHGTQACPGTSAKALAFILAAGLPVGSGEVAEAIGTSTNNASAHLAQMARAGKLVKDGTARRATWAPGPRALTAALPGTKVGWSREQIARKLGTDAGTVQRLLARIPVQPGEPTHSLGTDGRVHPRVRYDQPAAARGARPDADGELRLWTGYTFRRWLRIAAGKARLPLPKGQVTHTTRHYVADVLRSAGMTFEDIGEWIGDTAATVERAYSQPSAQARADAMAALAADRDAARQRPRNHLRIAGEST